MSTPNKRTFRVPHQLIILIVIAAIGMYISNLLINFVLCSSSSQVTTVIPIFSGVGDVLGLTQQTVVQTFNFQTPICQV